MRSVQPCRNRAGGSTSDDRAEAEVAPARGAHDQRDFERTRHHRCRRRCPLCVAAVAPVTVVCRDCDPHPRPRRRRRDRHLQHCRYGAAAAAAIPRAGTARLDLGEQRGEGAAEREAVAGQLHGLPQHAGRLLRSGGMVASRGEPRRPGHASRFASAPSRRAATYSSCSACRRSSVLGFPRTARSTRAI